VAISVGAINIAFRINPNSVSVFEDANAPLFYEVAIGIKDDQRVFAAGVNEDSPLQIASDGRYPSEMPTLRWFEPTFHNLKLVSVIPKSQTQIAPFPKVDNTFSIRAKPNPRLLT